MKKILVFISTLVILSIGVFLGFKIKDSIKEAKTSKGNSSFNASNEVTDIGKKVEDTISNAVTNIKEATATEKEKEYSSNDNKVIDSLSEAFENIKNSEVTEKFKDSAKATFITVVDFLFYDGEISGVKFSELTEKGKEKVLELAASIDDAIEKKVPNYKDTISDKTKEAYAKASTLIKKGSSNLNDFMKEKLSEESYNAIISAKDDLVYYSKNAVNFIKENSSSIFGGIKDKLSSWYQNFKNN